MKLDVGILFLAVALLAAVFGLLHLACWPRWRDRALLWWAAADGVGIAGLILRLSHNWLPPWIFRSVAVTAIFASGLLVWLGFRCFAGQSLPLRSFSAGTVLFFALFEILRSCFNDLALILVLTATAIGIANAGVAIDLARASLVDGTRIRAGLVAVFVLHALVCLFQSVTAVTVTADAVFLQTAGLQNAIMLFTVFAVLVWNAGALWLAGRRHRASGMVRANA